MDDVLEAEQAAAAAAADRRRTMRDRLLELEDRSARVVVSTIDGQIHRGEITAVGVDHLVLVSGHQGGDHRPAVRAVALSHVVSIEIR